ncbi:MAG: hypothetical protein ACRC4W_00400 [Treponemataceae bacterium]
MNKKEEAFFTSDYSQRSKEILLTFLQKLQVVNPNIYQQMLDKMSHLKSLSSVIYQFPSLLSVEETVCDVRTANTLADSLLSNKATEKTLYLPTKAILSKDFLVAKFQMLSWILKTARLLQYSTSEIESIRSVAVEIMFTLMSIDVYLTLVSDPDIAIERRHSIAYSLIHLWDCQASAIEIESFFGILRNIWSVRDTIAPAFGTMIGTSELLRLTMEMDERWTLFISQKLSIDDVSKALEEFIFGLSHEQIGLLQEKIRNTSKSLSRQEVYKELNGFEIYLEAEFDPRNFYQMYSLRRDNARARKRMQLAGPKRTLEEYYIKFIFEQFATGDIIQKKV